MSQLEDPGIHYAFFVVRLKTDSVWSFLASLISACDACASQEDNRLSLDPDSELSQLSIDAGQTR